PVAVGACSRRGWRARQGAVRIKCGWWQRKTGDKSMEHLNVRANGAAFHVAKTGAGRPLLLLHGWPEFWLTWEPVMTRLADRFKLYAPDLRGFGDSDKPDGPFGPEQQAADMVALMDALDLKQAGIVGHDVGGALMQPLARNAPARISGLFFYD